MKTTLPDRWPTLTAPDLDAFEVLARSSYERLPESFRALTGDLVIRVAEFADQDALDSLELSSPFELLGLFEGVGLAATGGLAVTGQMPNHIWLYRRPILDHWAESGETLGDIVTHVLIHEIGHHFGLSDADMEAIEAASD
ncbi:metallopeptidase family protein [Amorphus orientalis]|uniref:Zn-dependent protease with MMP-like domain n=1 Tax=Amorphus orientalis TaxID=649198 RepID=A0AAE4ARC1_9HYPH|nr:metallopeptidase family protein [Amorphus orientalis]MDQ0313680.1 putative Zn-dependent protease with MMP-like domain [Amorphus orientalis]